MEADWDMLRAMERRHAVRDYSDRPIGEGALRGLAQAVAEANAASGLDIQLIHGPDDALGGCPTHYGHFRNVRAMIALIGADADPHEPDDLDERIGYWGERLALTAVTLDLDTSWVVLHDTGKAGCPWTLADGERMPAAITIGYGNRPGRPHHSKPPEELGTVESGEYADSPDWFRHGIEAVALAPSALGRQPVRFTLSADGHSVRAEALEGLQSAICLGIAKLHFELGAGPDAGFVWA